MTTAGGTTSQFHVLDVEQGQPHLVEKGLLSGKCPLTPAGNISRHKKHCLASADCLEWHLTILHYQGA